MIARVVPKEEAEKWVGALHSAKSSLALGVLLAGDRWSCVEEAVLGEVEGRVVGIATIAPQGEEMSGKPTLVAIYILSEHRRSGIGYKLLEVAVDRMIAQGLVPVHIDAMNSKVLRMVARLPIEKRQKLYVVDQSMGGSLDAVLEK